MDTPKPAESAAHHVPAGRLIGRIRQKSVAERVARARNALQPVRTFIDERAIEGGEEWEDACTGLAECLAQLELIAEGR